MSNASRILSFHFSFFSFLSILHRRKTETHLFYISSYSFHVIDTLPKIIWLPGVLFFYFFFFFGENRERTRNIFLETARLILTTVAK